MNPRVAFGILFERDPYPSRCPLADHQVVAASIREAYLSRHPQARAPSAAPVDGVPGRDRRRS
jgi:hypothetical protein